MLVLIIFLCYATTQATAYKVTVYPNEECTGDSLYPCIDHELQSQNNTEIVLQPGVHIIQEFHLINLTNNFTIIGLGQVGDTVIICGKNNGLAFVYVHNLRLSNLKISGCGLGGVDLFDTVSHLHGILFPIFVTIPPMQVAVFLGICSDVLLERVIIENTTGVGLISYNIMNNLTLVDVLFKNNTSPLCDVESSESYSQTIFYQLVGGGFVMVYVDFINNDLLQQFSTNVDITISNSSFEGNRDCSFTGYVEQIKPLLPNIGNFLQSSGGGGLTILAAHGQFNFNVLMYNLSFIENIARFGSGIHLSIFHNTKGNNITIDNCEFDNNGYIFAVSTYLGGGGISIIDDIENIYVNTSTLSDEPRNSVSIRHSKFIGNIGRSGGGVAIFSSGFSSPGISMSFHTCNFSENEALVGAAVFVLANAALLKFRSPFTILINNCVFENNFIARYYDYSTSTPYSSDGIFSAWNALLEISGEVMFSDNLGSAITAVGTNINVQSEANLKLYRNCGVYGAGMKLLQFSYLVVQQNSTTDFVNNSAQTKGGALYVDLITFNIFSLTGEYDCFLYFGEINFFCIPDSTDFFECDNVANFQGSIRFDGNTAPEGGVVYGSSLRLCSWALELRSMYPNSTVFEILYTNFSRQFYFSDKPDSVSIVASGISKLNVDHNSLNLMTGQRGNIKLEGLDEFNQTVVGVVSSRTQSVFSAYQSLLDDTNFSLLESQTQLHILGPNESSNVTIDIVSTETQALVEVSVNVLPCPVGFIYNNTLQQCMCNPMIVDYGVECSVESGSFTAPDGYWIGLENNDSKSLLIIQYCYEDYCRRGEKVIYPLIDDYSVQCSIGYYRSGLGCGKCDDGYSNVVGSNRCSDCSNAFLALIIVVAFLGVLTVLAILTLAALKFTISDGYINGIIFYSNIVNHYTQVFITQQKFTFFFMPFAWVSLDAGLPICFHSGFNPLEHTFLEYMFPMYLILIVIVIGFLPRCFKCHRKLGLLTINTMATMLLLVYSSVSATCFRILALTVVYDTGTGTESLRWAGDPSVHYFQGFHAPLGILAIIIILVYVIPLPLILLFPQILYRNKRMNYLSPLYDTFWNPFKPKFRWWLGARLIFRTVSFLLAAYAYYPLNLFIMGLLVLALLYFHLIFQPFRGEWRNGVDAFFEFNLVFLFMGPVFFQGEKEQNSSEIYLVVILCTAYVAALSVTGYYVYRGIKQFKNKKIERVATNVETDSPPQVMIVTETEIDEFEVARSRILVKTPPNAVSFSVLREPLLESLPPPKDF